MVNQNRLVLSKDGAGAQLRMLRKLFARTPDSAKEKASSPMPNNGMSISHRSKIAKRLFGPGPFVLNLPPIDMQKSLACGTDISAIMLVCDNIYPVHVLVTPPNTGTLFCTVLMLGSGDLCSRSHIIYNTVNHCYRKTGSSYLNRY